MQQNRKLLVFEWLNKAEEDELNIKSILKHRDGTPSLACFLSQQMSEKCLKGLILFYSGDYPKIHSLVSLIDILNNHSIGISAYLKKEIAILDPYYIKTRYFADTSAESFTWEMAEEAYASANKVKKIVLDKIKL